MANELSRRTTPTIPLGDAGMDFEARLTWFARSYFS
jgi:hypothetical protein